MTNQIMECIEFKERGYLLEEGQLPLESLLKYNPYSKYISSDSNSIRLSNSWDVSDISEKDKLFRPDFQDIEVSGIPGSNCWRGYVGEWLVENQTLYLKNIHGFNPNKKSIFSLLFPYEKNLVVANWFSGLLDIVGQFDSHGSVIDCSILQSNNPQILYDYQYKHIYSIKIVKGKIITETKI